MATVIQKERNRAGAGASTRALASQNVAVTMAAGATASGSITVPEGSWLHGIRAETATAFSGTPTNINLRVGTAAAGQQVVADVDVKAQGHVAATIVAAFDSVTGATTYYYQIAATGGTNPAGTVNVRFEYWAPNP